MSMDLKTLTMTLCSLPGPSGFESPVRDFIADYVRPFADEVKTDALGSVAAVKRCGVKGAETLLLDAHMDEIGLIVTAAEDGFLRFSKLGGVDARTLAAREVTILTDPPLYGVIDTMPPHVLSEEDTDRAVAIDKLAIDAGLSQEQAGRLVPPGTPVVFEGACEEIGGWICGKALDDRACAAILIKAFEALSAMPLGRDIALLISTQEEVGSRGAIVGAWNAAPERAIVVDVTFSKTPHGGDVTTEAGKGAAIGIGPNMNRAMTEALFELARKREISVQPEVCPGDSGTNAAAIQVSRGGVATALVSLPIRYMHTPVEMALRDDMESVLQLITAYAASQEG